MRDKKFYSAVTKLSNMEYLTEEKAKKLGAILKLSDTLRLFQQD